MQSGDILEIGARSIDCAPSGATCLLRSTRSELRLPSFTSSMFASVEPVAAALPGEFGGDMLTTDAELTICLPPVVRRPVGHRKERHSARLAPPGRCLKVSRMAPHEYLAMEREATGKHELWEGEVFAMAGASLAHNILVGNLARVLGNLLVEGPCIVLPSDMKVYVPLTEGYVYPDLSVVCGKPEVVGDSQDVIANPSVIVEVLSDCTERFDRGEKFAGYRSLPSLHNYLLVSQNRVRIEHYERQLDGGWLLRQHGAGEALGLSCAAGKIAVDDVYLKVERQP